MREYSGLLTDLYELTMAAGYVQTRFQATATFEFFIRNVPEHRNYLIAAGLDQALEFLENVILTRTKLIIFAIIPFFAISRRFLRVSGEVSLYRRRLGHARRHPCFCG